MEANKNNTARSTVKTSSSEKLVSLSLSQIAKITNAQLVGDGKATIEILCTDSRAISFPEDSLFVALITSRNDGHNYIADLLSSGVRSFLVSKLPEDISMGNFLLVKNTHKALQQIAMAHRNLFHIPVVGITGSNGKTIVKEWLHQLLQDEYVISRSPRSFNSQIGVPLSVWGLNKQTQLGIFEAGISMPGEMELLAPVINPTIGIFTHLGQAHQEDFSSLKEKCNEKLRLFENANYLIYKKDDKLIDISVAQSAFRGEIFTWGKSQADDVCIQKIKTDFNQTLVVYSYKNNEYELRIPFSDEASIENVMHCLCLLLLLNFSPDFAQRGILKLQSVAMRLEVKEGENNCLVIDDTYNLDLSSLPVALDFLKQQATHSKLKQTLIISDIFQSQLQSAELYAHVAQLIHHKKIEKLIAIGKDLHAHKQLFHLDEQYFFLDTDSFLQSKQMHEFCNEAILLKGSRKFKFENISEQLEAIVHQTILEVDLNALIHNVNYFRSHLLPETKLMSMVKAYAYGSGDVEVARCLQQNKCDYLAVAVADEGADLRKEGIHTPIVVMNPEVGAFGKIFEYKLEPEIYNFRLLDAFAQNAKKRGITNYPIHIKIDTGMHRLGFAPEEVDKLIEQLKNQESLQVRSVFSHLVGSDSPELDPFTEAQATLFLQCAEKFTQSFSHKILKHVLNSAGIERFPQYQFDMVRLGIGHYGISATDHASLEEVCTLKTSILQIRKVSAGDTVGYSRKGQLTRDSLIGAIPLGYADGYDRKLGNGVGKVLVNGHIAPVVGNVCMDVTMIDLTGIPAQEGDTVVLFGKEHSIRKMAHALQTIPYEVLTSISRRVKRIYFKD